MAAGKLPSRGQLKYPEPTIDGPWNGFGVLQAK
jgi:hypothetical protein